VARAVPSTLTILDGAMAMDGGSIDLRATDDDGRPLRVYLDWSIDSHACGMVQLYVDDVAVPKRSDEEARWLDALRGCGLGERSSDRAPPRKILSDTNILLADDDATVDYFAAIEQGPGAALRALVKHLVSNVESEAYAAPSTISADDRVRELLRQGERHDAIRVYRAAHPELSLAAAVAAVDALGVEG
jgi:hypothetical protein